MTQHNIVHLETNRFTELRRRILKAEPDIDKQTLNDTLEGASNLSEVITAAVRSALDDRTMIEALRLRIGDLKARLARFERAEEHKRAAARWAMEESGLDKIVAPDLTISLKKTHPSVTVIDESQIPEWFWVPQPAKLDKRAVLNALKSGTAVSGAEIANTSLCLSVRTR
ncbi:MAG: siphovirus Gp157 family protein [Rhizobiaceae bacterium]|nr:siphovirus Gp157 family protein [Rhizobiaceae bacterium]